MAIITNGINGGFTGKAGSVIGYQRLGKWIIKGRPRLSRKNKKGSADQKANRSLFTKMQYFLSPILPFIRVGFNLEGKSRQMTAHNAAKSYNLLNAFTAEGEIDYSKVLISYGKRAGALNANVVKDDTGLQFTWTDNTDKNWPIGNDQVILLAYDVDNKQIYGMLSGARRSACYETIALSQGQEKISLHVWIAFIADDRESISMSTYLGEIVY